MRDLWNLLMSIIPGFIIISCMGGCFFLFCSISIEEERRLREKYHLEQRISNIVTIQKVDKGKFTHVWVRLPSGESDYFNIGFHSKLDPKPGEKWTFKYNNCFELLRKVEERKN